MLHIRSLAQNNVNTAYDIFYDPLREDRIRRDISTMEDIEGVELILNEDGDYDSFHLIVTPMDGYYRNRYSFLITVPPYFPNNPYKVKLETKVSMIKQEYLQIFHPNIDVNGNVCLNILREQWSPIIDLTQVACSLQYLLSEPNPNDYLNQEAAELLLHNKSAFLERIAQYLSFLQTQFIQKWLQSYTIYPLAGSNC